MVEELIAGRDDVARGAKVRLVQKGRAVFLSRPVQKLYPTEVKHDEGKKERKKKDECVSKENEKREVCERREGRPKRAAALDSVWKTKSMVD